MSLMAIDLLGPIFNPYQPSRGFTYAAGQCLVDIALVPVRMVLAMIQASLLPSDERPISPLNEALVGDGKCGGSCAVGGVVQWGRKRRVHLLAGTGEKVSEHHCFI